MAATLGPAPTAPGGGLDVPGNPPTAEAGAGVETASGTEAPEQAEVGDCDALSPATPSEEKTLPAALLSLCGLSSVSR